MVKSILISTCLLCFGSTVNAQKDSAHTPGVDKKKFVIVAAGNAVFYTGSYLLLNKAWYADYEKSGFHFFNDNPEWNQMDKAGHVWSTYQVSRVSARVWQWTGISRSQAAIAGGISGMVYQSIIELQDAYSAAWGFSWGDVAANVAGAGLFVFQDLGWQQQKIVVKMGYHPYNYPPDLLARRDQLFGKSTAERIFKDYNAQTYWISGNLSLLLRDKRIPSWLNVSLGYGADGMYGGRANYWSDEEGQVFDYTHIARSRQVYLSPDIDLTRIKTKSKTLRSIFSVVNAFRIPMPALELQQGRIRGVIR